MKTQAWTLVVCKLLKKKRGGGRKTSSCNEHETYTDYHSFIFREFSLLLLACKTDQSRKKKMKTEMKKASQRRFQYLPQSLKKESK